LTGVLNYGDHVWKHDFDSYGYNSTGSRKFKNKNLENG
jgi:hypothetical protein